MVVTTSASVAGHQTVKTIGMVCGCTVRSRHVGKDILAGFKTLIGGEVNVYTEMMEEARSEAVERMVSEGSKLGANSIIDVRFSSAAVPPMSEITAYGTAVVIEAEAV